MESLNATTKTPVQTPTHEAIDKSFHELFSTISRLERLINTFNGAGEEPLSKDSEDKLNSYVARVYQDTSPRLDEASQTLRKLIEQLKETFK